MNACSRSIGCALPQRLCCLSQLPNERGVLRCDQVILSVGKIGDVGVVEA